MCEISKTAFLTDPLILQLLIFFDIPTGLQRFSAGSSLFYLLLQGFLSICFFELAKYRKIGDYRSMNSLIGLNKWTTKKRWSEIPYVWNKKEIINANYNHLLLHTRDDGSLSWPESVQKKWSFSHKPVEFQASLCPTLYSFIHRKFEDILSVK